MHRKQYKRDSGGTVNYPPTTLLADFKVSNNNNKVGTLHVEI